MPPARLALAIRTPSLSRLARDESVRPLEASHAASLSQTSSATPRATPRLETTVTMILAIRQSPTSKSAVKGLPALTDSSGSWLALAPAPRRRVGSAISFSSGSGL